MRAFTLDRFCHEARDMLMRWDPDKLGAPFIAELKSTIVAQRVWRGHLGRVKSQAQRVFLRKKKASQMLSLCMLQARIRARIQKRIFRDRKRGLQLTTVAKRIWEALDRLRGRCMGIWMQDWRDFLQYEKEQKVRKFVVGLMRRSEHQFFQNWKGFWKSGKQQRLDKIIKVQARARLLLTRIMMKKLKTLRQREAGRKRAFEVLRKMLDNGLVRRIERWVEFVAEMKYERYVKRTAAKIKARYERMNMRWKVRIFRAWLGDTWAAKRAKAIMRRVMMEVKVSKFKRWRTYVQDEKDTRQRIIDDARWTKRLIRRPIPTVHKRQRSLWPDRSTGGAPKWLQMRDRAGGSLEKAALPPAGAARPTARAWKEQLDETDGLENPLRQANRRECAAQRRGEPPCRGRGTRV